jgi:hypothetical protein
MHETQIYLVEESEKVIQEGFDRLLNRIKTEATGRTRGLVVVLVSPSGRSSVGVTYHIDTDPWLKRLKSQGVQITTLSEFSSFIQSAKAQVTQGKRIPVTRFPMANARPGPTRVYSPASTLKAGSPREPSSSPVIKESPTREASSSKWNLSDFLPALFPHPPLPRGLFKDQSTQAGQERHG